jgi:hypothetical protein
MAQECRASGESRETKKRALLPAGRAKGVRGTDGEKYFMAFAQNQFFTLQKHIGHAPADLLSWPDLL